MKSIILWLLLYGITSINCAPNLKTGKPNFLDLDLANVDTKEFNLIKSSGEPEAYKISSKNDKTINSVKIKDNVVWSRKKSECVGVTIYNIEGHLLFVFNIVEGESKYNLHYYKDDTVESIGVIEFLALLNSKMRPEDSTVTLNLSDEYSKLFYAYKIKRSNDMTYELFESDEEFEIDTIVDDPVAISSGEVRTEFSPAAAAAPRPAERTTAKDKKEPETTDKAPKDAPASNAPKETQDSTASKETQEPKDSKAKNDAKPEESKHLDSDKDKKDSSEPKLDVSEDKAAKPTDDKESAKADDAEAKLTAAALKAAPPADKKLVWKSHANDKLAKKVEVYKNEGRHQFILVTLADKTVVHLKRSRLPVSDEKAVRLELPEKAAAASENSSTGAVDAPKDPGFRLGSGWKVITREKFEAAKGHKGLKVFDAMQEPTKKVVDGKLVSVRARDDVLDLSRHSPSCTYTSNKIMDNLFVVIVPRNPKRLKKLVFTHRGGSAARVAHEDDESSPEESSADEDLGSVDGVKVRPPLTVGDAAKLNGRPEEVNPAAKSEEAEQAAEDGHEPDADKLEFDKLEADKAKPNPSEQKQSSKTKRAVATTQSHPESQGAEKKKAKVDLLYYFGTHANNEHWTDVIVIYTKLSSNVHYVEVVASKNGRRVPNMFFKYSASEGVSWRRGPRGWERVIVQQSRQSAPQEAGRWLRFSECAYRKSLAADLRRTATYLEFFGVEGLGAGEPVAALPEHVRSAIASTPAAPESESSESDDASETPDADTDDDTHTDPPERPVDVTVVPRDGEDVNAGEVSEELDESSAGATVPLVYVSEQDPEKEEAGFRAAGPLLLFLLLFSFSALT